MAYDIIVFGNSFDGEMVTVDKFQDELLLNPRKVIQLSGSRSSTYSRMSSNKDVTFKVVKYKSEIDGKFYLIALEDGFTPSDIGIKISWQNPSPVNEK